MFRILLSPFDDRPERADRKAALTLGLLAVANLAAWAWAWRACAGRPALMGTAVLAWVFGLRHAFDADHIAAIDNVVRKLMREGKAPGSVGFFFSFGHSTVVVPASVLIAATAAAFQPDAARDVGSTIGTAVSALFLLGLGTSNLLVLRGIWAAFKRARHGLAVTEDDLDTMLAGSGFLSRLFRAAFRIVSQSWHMYPVGMLFALGFDTATEVGLLGISATQAAQGLSFWTILVFPALFTAGMSLMDTADSVLMTRAYGWALSNPLRKLWYNLTITAASVLVATFIGGIELLGLVEARLGLEGRFWVMVGDLNANLANFGIVVAGIFVGSWLISAAIYRVKGYDRLPAGRS
jgi:high-affinity nickel-transport protein